MLTEIVDGKVVQLSAADEAAVRAQWAADDAAQTQYNQTQGFLDQRNQAISTQIGSLMTLLFNDITAGTPLLSGTFYAQLVAIDAKFPKPAVVVTPT